VVRLALEGEEVGPHDHVAGQAEVQHGVVVLQVVAAVGDREISGVQVQSTIHLHPTSPLPDVGGRVALTAALVEVAYSVVEVADFEGVEGPSWGLAVMRRVELVQST
jgi:hypothetical protein